MPINRAPFNALVDDDGSGLTGSTWNKSAIAGVLLDPIDAVIPQHFQNVPFSAANFSALAPMTWTVGAQALQANRYCVVGKLLFWTFYISWFSGGNVIGGSPSTTLFMTLPGGLQVASLAYGLCAYVQVPGVPVAGGLFYSNSGADKIALTKSVGGDFVVGGAPGIITTVILEVL